MLALGDQGQRSSAVLLRNADAAEQRYTGPHHVDADRFHWVGPRQRDLHLAHRRGQAEINNLVRRAEKLTA
jgi:hypothetical protein